MFLSVFLIFLRRRCHDAREETSPTPVGQREGQRLSNPRTSVRQNSGKILMWNGHGKSSVHSMRFYSTRTFCPNRRFPKEDLMDSVSAEPSQELSLLRPSSPYSLCFVHRPLASTCSVQSGDGRRRHSALLPRQALQLPRFPQFLLTLMGF